MAIHPIEFRYGSDEMRDVFEEESRLQKLLDVEASLARAHAVVGSIPQQDADVITKNATVKRVKVERVKEIEATIYHDLMAVVKTLTEVCGDSGKYIHLGATSYDIIDTANALQFKEALSIVEHDLLEIESKLLRLADETKKLVAIGRTHGQHAVPITYGLKFAIWTRELRRHINRIEEGKKRFFAGKMTGAVGTQASFDGNGIEIQDIVMKDLGIYPAVVSNQVVQRDSYAELMSLLALICTSMEKFAKEFRNLMRTEIGELSEGYVEKSQVGSSTMPHKRNPIKAEKICGLARVVRANLSVALENVPLEHERDLTNSSAERVIIGESFILTDEILKSMIKILDNIVLDKDKINENLGLTKGLNLAEAVMIQLVKRGMGRQKAHELLRTLAVKSYNDGRDFGSVLKESQEVSELLSDKEVDETLKPENYIGTAVEQVENVIKLSNEEKKK